MLKDTYCYLNSTSLPALEQTTKAVQAFFSQPLEYKNKYHRTDHPEIGYRHIQNKEMFMLRNRQIPEALSMLLPFAESLHQLAIQCLKNIAKELQCDETVLLNLIEPHAIPTHGLSSSILRLNHYKHIPNDTSNTILTPVHEDLGLLTLVCPTNVPALEIYGFSLQDQGWMDVEATQQPNQLIVMSGEALTKISNGYFIPASHRIRMPFKDRTSVVYQLRVKQDALIDSALFETPITGQFSKPFRVTGQAYLQSEMAVRQSVNGSY